MVNEGRIVEEFIELVKIDSVSGREREVADYLKNKLEKMGLEVYEDKAGAVNNTETGNIIAWLAGNKGGVPTILFSAHMDTVEPGRGVEPVIQDGIITSKGETVLGGDDKAGIAAILEAIRVIIENNIPRGDIEVVFSVMEETGLLGVKSLDRSKLKAQMAYVLDSSGPAGNIVVRGPAQDKIVVTVHGKAAHAGMAPEEGINAIAVASKAISKLNLGRLDEETTANIGIITGGKAANIVPDKVYVEGEARSLDPEKLKKITAEICKTFEEVAGEEGAKVEIKTELLYNNINLNENDPVVKIAVEAAKNLDLKPKLVGIGGGSDANILNGYGIPAANLGIGMNKVHTTEESMAVKDLVLNAKYLVEIIQTAARQG